MRTDRVLPARPELVEPDDPRATRCRSWPALQSVRVSEARSQCIYIDPPYGIKFNSNFQWSTTSRDVKDGNAGHITREPEQVKAFRDHLARRHTQLLDLLRDRLTVARDLLTESGSVFVQIGDENVHRVRAVMDEVFWGRKLLHPDHIPKDDNPIWRHFCLQRTIFCSSVCEG